MCYSMMHVNSTLDMKTIPVSFKLLLLNSLGTVSHPTFRSNTEEQQLP